MGSSITTYTFEINYKEGKKLTAADGLSRRLYEDTKVDEDEDEELAEDSFITEITPDLFETVTSLKQKKRRRQNRGLITSLDEESDEEQDESDRCGQVCSNCVYIFIGVILISPRIECKYLHSLFYEVTRVFC